MPQTEPAYRFTIVFALPPDMQDDHLSARDNTVQIWCEGPGDDWLAYGRGELTKLFPDADTDKFSPISVFAGHLQCLIIP